MERTSG